jgi:hypothetical protein
MIRGKYGAVIGGRETRFFVCTRYEFPGCGFPSANHSTMFPPDHQTTYGIAPNDSVSSSQTVVDPSQLWFRALHLGQRVWGSGFRV